MHGKDSAENRKQQADYYDKYTERQERIGVNKRHISILEKTRSNGLTPSAEVLEIGCGIGTFSGLLGKFLKDGKAFCMDISPKSIEIAQNEYRNLKSLKFVEGNAVNYDFGNLRFDTIILPDVIEHIPLENHSQLFANLSSILKPDGFIFINIPNPYYLQWCHENRPKLLQIIDQPIYTAEFVQNTAPHGLYISDLRTYSLWVEDGDYQCIVLKKDGWQNFEKNVEEKITFWDKVKYKLNGSK